MIFFWKDKKCIFYECDFLFIKHLAGTSFSVLRDVNGTLPNTCHMSHVICNMSNGTCHISSVTLTCHFFLLLFSSRTMGWYHTLSICLEMEFTNYIFFNISLQITNKINNFTNNSIRIFFKPFFYFYFIFRPLEFFLCLETWILDLY